jgi:hypothetical protein
VEQDSRDVILHLLTEAIRQSGEPAHPPGEVLTLQNEVLMCFRSHA